MKAVLRPKLILFEWQDGERLVELLDNLFSRSDNVRASFDENTSTLLVVARPQQHATVQKLIEDIEPLDAEGQLRTLEIYSLPGSDGKTATSIAQGMLRPSIRCVRFLGSGVTSAIVTTTPKPPDRPQGR